MRKLRVVVGCGCQGLFRWTGTIKPGVSHAIASSMDYLPTIAALTGLTLPTEGECPTFLCKPLRRLNGCVGRGVGSEGGVKQYDGIDLTAVLLHGASVGHTTLYHPACSCGAGLLNAMRWLKDGAEYKAHWMTGVSTHRRRDSLMTLS